MCPYCGSTIFSDYYDWQLESLEIEPEHLKLRGFIGWMIIVLASGGNGSRVKKRTKQKIVRFSCFLYEKLCHIVKLLSLEKAPRGITAIRLPQNLHRQNGHFCGDRTADPSPPTHTYHHSTSDPWRGIRSRYFRFHLL